MNDQSYENEVIVTLHNLPTSVKGAVSIADDGTPCIHINARLSHDEQVKAYMHEMEHIRNNDFHNLKRIDAIEY